LDGIDSAALSNQIGPSFAVLDGGIARAYLNFAEKDQRQQQQ
jgi:hypothetical protein